MVSARRAVRLVLAGLLLQATLPGHADGRWACRQVTDEVWECTGATLPARTPRPAADEAANSTTGPDGPAASTAPEDAGAVPGTPGAAQPVPPAAAGLPVAEPAPPGPDATTVDVAGAAVHGDTAAAARATPGPGTTAMPAVDAERASLCPPAPVPGHLAGSAGPDVIDLRADRIRASRERAFTLSGDAVVRYGEQQLRAGNITYTRADGVLEATNGVRFAGPSLVVDADSARIETEAERGRLENITYSVPGQYARGDAHVLGFEGPTRQYLETASYTACPPGNRDWLLTAGRIELDQAGGTGVARNAKLTFKDVPLLYTPYISFPLDERRKTGLLFPKIGTTDETGLDISLPWYWNISPRRDLTLTPRLMSDRGVMLGGEFRYLNRRSAGSISAEYLPNDKEFQEEDRSLVSLNHHGNPVPRLSTRITASNVSDTQYFEDLGSTLVQTSQTSLERTAELGWHGDGWQAGIMVQDFQNIDTTLASVDRPYKQLPRIVFSLMPQRRLLGLQASAAAELNNFTHSDNTAVTGSRLDIMPRFSLPLERPGWYIRPTVAVRHTAYLLDNAGAGKPDRPTRTLPVATLDLGTFFERNGQWSGRPYIQTLEPRLFYLYVQHKDQADLPVFDTDNYDQNFSSLFRENRFSGPDRMGDANQLAVALTSRIVDPASGRQLMSASLGSLLYFRDRLVTLPGETVATNSNSDVIGELDVALSRRWSARGEVHWNPNNSQSVRNTYQMQYFAGPRRLVNLGYRFRDGIQEQADISFLWPLSRAWHAVGRWYYAMDNHETIEALAGLGYERCCWGIQVLGRSYINRSSGQGRNNAVFVQLELKGLGKLGSSVDEALERGILGSRRTH